MDGLKKSTLPQGTHSSGVWGRMGRALTAYFVFPPWLLLGSEPSLALCLCKNLSLTSQEQ